ncbi:hypothetical protein F2Q70_00042992 [Brassica cretica]|uniref:Uncharacterized protein n=1 Tax=Brassica cretica TaxID=69181 RepID=A0A8S9KPE5_BRACR|nr:hypothetical protein F2Q70_00042992 [Brassica cretica]
MNCTSKLLVLILHEILDKLLIEQVAAYKGFQFSDITKEDLREFTKGRSTATLVFDLKTIAKDISEWQVGHVTLILGSIRILPNADQFTSLFGGLNLEIYFALGLSLTLFASSFDRTQVENLDMESDKATPA